MSLSDVISDHDESVEDFQKKKKKSSSSNNKK